MAILDIFSSNAPSLEWQKLKSKNKNIPDLYRSPVPGGWIISQGGISGGMIFLPDPEHEWDGESLKLY